MPEAVRAGRAGPFERMFWKRRDPAEKERRRYYLLPGMGRRAYRRKQRVILKYSIAFGLVISGLLAVVLYFLNRPRF